MVVVVVQSVDLNIVATSIALVPLNLKNEAGMVPLAFPYLLFQYCIMCKCVFTSPFEPFFTLLCVTSFLNKQS